MGLLKDFINNKSVAIVANSKDGIGSKKGTIIDSHDVVIRMQNFSIELQYQEDFGSKTDLWVTDFRFEIKRQRDRDMEFANILCPIPLNTPQYISKYGIDGDHRRRFLLNKYIDEFIPLEYYVELVKKVSYPSTGLAFLYWVYKEKGIIDYNNDMFGFSFQGLSDHYFDNKTKSVYDWDAELAVVKEITTLE